MSNQLKNHKYILYFFFIALLFNTSYAQNLSNLIEIGSSPDNQNFFWAKHNNFGFKNYPNYQKTKISILESNFEIEMNIFSSISELKSTSLNTSYLRFKINDKSYLRIGRYYRDFSNYLNDELSSGSILISNNAKAMPKVGFVSNKKLNKNNISFDYGISHAVFDKNELYKSSPFLHEKFVYMNLNNSNYKLSVGFVHEAMWGGSTILQGNQPDTIKDFFKVFISADGPKKENEPHANALGNHLGIWDFYFQKITGEKNVKLYYQHFFEDTSGLRFANKWDGLWGIELVNYISETNILLEFIDTTNQNINPPYVNDAYYNHSIYSGGWSYKGYTLGNPFLSHNGINPSKIVHLGISGVLLNEYFYEIKASKRINISNIIKYQLIIKKELYKNHIIKFSAFNNDYNIGLGLSFTKVF